MVDFARSELLRGRDGKYLVIQDHCGREQLFWFSAPSSRRTDEHFTGKARSTAFEGGTAEAP
eukprot:11217039-Lingulodinium_polyedra.AAC.1